ncbi:MAG: DUF3784 domain-containing protein [Oscillospiraceae bacterium]|jgi:hypothetical protein|nr:DUF3784 domain-containing protein [Oscillospiraceae bacterium]
MPLLVIFSLVGALLIGFGALVRFKKNYMIISGINTSTPERRAQMDLDAICRVVGNALMLGGGLFIAAGVCFALSLTLAPLVMIPLFFALIFGTWIYVQKYDKNYTANRSKRSKILLIVIVCLVSAAICVLVGGMMVSDANPPVVTMDGSILKIDAVFGCEIGRGSVTSANLTATLPPLVRTVGSGIGPYLKGAVSGGGLGAGRAYVKTDAPPFILLTLNSPDEHYLYLNLRTPEETETLYADIQTWLSAP